MNAPFPASEEPDTYSDYVEAYRSEAARADHMTDRWGQMHEKAKTLLAAADQKHADLEARVGDVIRQMQAAGNQYWAGVLADALTNKEKP